MNPQEHAPALRDLVRRAGRAIMEVYQRLHGGQPRAGEVQRKDDGSPLTEADLRAQQIIAAGLNTLAPQAWVVSEEDLERRAQAIAAGAFWLVDPLDGTREFVNGQTDFTVNIAWVSQGRPVWGIVHAPVADVSWWGGAGLGAWRALADAPADPIRVQPRPPGQPARVLASRSHLDAQTRQWIDALGACELVQAGSSLKFCRIAEGAADVYPRFGPTAEWDTAAAHAVVEGAGGRVCQPDGQPLRYGKPDALNPSFIVSA